ncbi:hypothetical protein PSEUBRA_004947 [Kalmanozyma brasiliensis GHG001]|nr:uncharacterized protein PSEUBRA_004947 [Kalmanozyma brasiliensis GHG001]EST05899.2 hypothetical protein PSEUBRA_004947 [Kalmanozyma brasiliensis GHG001]
MKIECKWPEVDFRRAKTGDAAKARRKTPPGASTQRSPVSVDLKHHSRLDASVSDDNAYRRTSDGALPASQSMPTASFAPAALPVSDSQVSSPKSNRGYRYRTHSDGDRQARHAEAPVHAARSPTERFAYPGPQERRADPYARAEAYARPYSSTGMPDARQDVPMLDDRAQPYPQEHRAPVWEDRTSRPIRALPELRPPQRDPAAIRCRNRAAQIAVLARPATDSERIAVEAHLSTESNLEDLADQATAGERLDHAFATDWDAIGGLAPAARRPFMDVAAGLVGVLEISDMDAQRGHARVSAESVGRLHLFRLRHGSTDAVPDLRHLNIAMDLPLAERRELLETTSSPYNTLSYPIPVDRLSRPLVEVMRRGHHEKQEEQQVKHGRASNVGTGAALRSFPPPSDSIPIVRKEDIKPPQAIQELFLQAYIRAIGEQMPGLNTNVVAARIRDGSISALLANALCAIGASLYERRGQRPSIGEALSSKVYVERARALLGAAIQNPDIEAILALGVMAIRDILLGQTISAAVIVSSAVRLCMQLDLHRSRAKKPPSTQEGDDAVTKLKADDMFWMIYCLDRITSIATARPLAIKDRDIDTPFPATMRNNEPCIFAALVRQLHYLGRLVDIAVSGAGTNADRTRDLELAAIAADLNAHYTSLPATLLLSKTNLNLAQDRGEPLSYLQLHLTHHLALLHRFLLSRGGMTSGEHDAMRAAAAAVVQICKMGEEVNATLLADTPLSAAACFLAGCVQLAEIEAGDDEAAQSALECVMTTLSRHAEFWPVAGGLADVLHAERSRFRTQLLSAKALGKIVSQVEAVHVVVRRPSEELDGQQAVKVVKVDDLDVVRGAFPHLC